MDTIKIWNDSPSRKQLGRIAEELEAGKIVILPTDTMYALVVDAFNSKAIDRLCEIKGLNPDKQTLSILCRDISMAAEYARISDKSFRIMRLNLPGPFTFILKASSNLPKAFKGRKEVGIRIPESRLIAQLTDYIGHPLMATSIIYDSEDEAVSPGLIEETHDGKADLMVEGEEGSLNLSTIVDLKEEMPEILREGIGKLQ